MSTALLPALAPVASPAEADALSALLSEGESPVSDAPTFWMSVIGVGLLLLGSKEPKEKR